jgi:hypothetical protein
MDNQSQITKQRAERTRTRKFTTPLPFDHFDSDRYAKSPPSIQSSQSPRPSDPLSGIKDSRQYDNSNFESSYIPKDSSASRGSSINLGRQPESRPKHVPLYTLIDFRQSHSRHATSRNGRPSEEVDWSNSQNHSRQASVNDQRVEHPDMNSSNSRPTTSLRRVPISHPFTDEQYTPQTRGKPTKPPELSSELENLSLDAEFEEYQRRHTRPSYGLVYLTNPEDDKSDLDGVNPQQTTAPWTKQGWEMRARQSSSSPKRTPVESLFVNRDSDSIEATLESLRPGSRAWNTSRPRNVSESRTPSVRSAASAAPAPVIPLRDTNMRPGTINHRDPQRPGTQKVHFGHFAKQAATSSRTWL